MGRTDRKLIIVSIGIVSFVAVLPTVLLLGPFQLGKGDAARLTAILTFVGVLVGASISLIGLMVSRQQSQVQQRQLRLDAAMRAGQLFSPTEAAAAHPAALASGLLALTRLDHSDLAVALLVDLWSRGPDGTASPDGEASVNGQDQAPAGNRGDRVSTETAILVIDAALRSKRQNAQLVAAELLCRNADRLNACHSLHWPCAIEGRWDRNFSPRTKLLLVEGLVNMTLASPTTESALRSVAVRLYGIWRDDPDPRVKGCIGKLISALIDRLSALGYHDFVQGNQQVMIDDLRKAAASCAINPDGYLDQLSTGFADRLKDWAGRCTGLPRDTGRLATASP